MIVTQYDLMQRIANIKLAAFDVDGTFTDGRLYYDADGRVLKGFSAQDGMGLQLLHRAGIKRGFITGRHDRATEARANYLDVDFYKPSVGDKAEVLAQLAEEYGITLDECLFAGDDLNDLTGLRSAGVSIAVANAVPAVKQYVDYITDSTGGSGAVREIVELILEAKGIDSIELWLSDKDTPVGKYKVIQ